MGLPDLEAVLRAEGVAMRVDPTWRAHVRPGPFAPVGNMVHHTADKGRGDSGEDVLRWGRRGSNPLLGPLCNGSPRESGLVVLMSAGRANHAGMGSKDVLDRILRDEPPGRPGPDSVVGNGLFYGWEVDNDGLGQAYPPVQIDATVRCCAATTRAYGWSVHRTITHAEWTRRKGDWSYSSGEQLRDLLADHLRKTSNQPLRPPPGTTGRDDVVRLYLVTRQTPQGPTSLRTFLRTDGKLVWLKTDEEAEALIAGGFPQVKMTGDAYDRFTAVLSRVLS